MFITGRIPKDGLGLIFADGVFKGLTQSGRIFLWNLRNRKEVLPVDLRSYVFTHNKLKEIIQSGKIDEEIAEVLDVKDHQRAILWVDGRFDRILGPGNYLLWRKFTDYRYEVVDARSVEFSHPEVLSMAQSSLDPWLNQVTVAKHHAAILYFDGVVQKTLSPGRYFFWSRMAEVTTEPVDLRQKAIDINGQDLITSDFVTIRINALVSYQVIDPEIAVRVSDNLHQSVYRAAQLTLRSVVGNRSLEQLLESKEWVETEAMNRLVEEGKSLGLEVLSVGVRDLILPGEMKILLNRVIEAKKQAEANLILRREETAAIRSQANTAKLLDTHPTLMKLRQLEVLEKVSQSSDLKIVLGKDDSLTERVTDLL